MGWRDAELGNFMVERGGSVNPALFPDEEFDLYSIPAHDRGGFVVARGDEIGSSKRVVIPGDVMVSRIVPHIQRARVVDPIGTRRQSASTEWISFRSSVHDPQFLRYFLLSGEFHNQFMRTVSGVGGSLNRAQPSRVRSIRVPVPPVDEQRRIVAILEEHLSRLDAATASLNVASRKVEEWRHAEVDAALWTPGVETVPILSLLREPMRNGRSDRASPDGRGTRTLTITAVTKNDFSEGNTKFTLTSVEAAAGLWLEPGDIFVQRSNTPELVGSVSRYDGPRDWAIYPDLLIRLRADESKVTSEYMAAALRSRRVHRTLRAKAKGLAGSMPKIDQGAIGSTAIPIVAVPEQRALISRLAVVEESARRSLAAIEAQRRRAIALRRSLLAAAFRGKLR